jgi:hypothetical protein
MSETSKKQSPDRIGEDPAATPASTKQETDTHFPPKTVNITNNSISRVYSSRSQPQLN